MVYSEGDKRVTAGILESKDRWKGAESANTLDGRHDIRTIIIIHYFSILCDNT